MMDLWQARGGGQFCVVFDDCPVMLRKILINRKLAAIADLEMNAF